MEYRGHIRNGLVVLDKPANLAEGTEVSVKPIEKKPVKMRRKTGGKNLLQRLASVAGKAEGLPSDLARNHDHYLHGLPKK